MIKGFTKLSTHVPHQAPPLTPSDIKRMCDALSTLGPAAMIARTAVLVGVCSMLRQSNLLPGAGGPTTHTLLRGDVEDCGDCIWLNIHSSKTINDPARGVALPLPPTGSDFCPVRAWRAYVRRLPLHRSYPAFMSETVTPLCPRRLVAFMRTSLYLIGHPAAGEVTVHSLRRSGAQACARARVPESDIVLHGTWSSSAISSYVPKKLYTAVPSAFKALFGHKD